MREVQSQANRTRHATLSYNVSRLHEVAAATVREAHLIASAKRERLMVARGNLSECGAARRTTLLPFAPRPHEQRESTMDRAPQRSEERSV